MSRLFCAIKEKYIDNHPSFTGKCEKILQGFIYVYG